MTFRLPPAGPVHAYRTFGISAPLSTHFRTATCEEAACPAYLNGWITRAATQEQADYIRRHSGRSFTEDAPGVFRFAAGQTCFGAADHKVRIEREEIYIARDGDWRGNPTGNVRRHTSAALWVEEFAEHQDVLIRARERG